MVSPAKVPELVARRQTVSVETKIRVVANVLVQKMSYVDAGAANGVSYGSARAWSRAQLEDPEYLEKLAADGLRQADTRSTMQDLLRLRQLSGSPWHRLTDLKRTTEVF